MIPAWMIPWGLLAAMAVFAGLLMWRLDMTNDKLAVLQRTNDQLRLTIVERDNALKSRAATDSDVRRLPPDGVLDRLR